MSNWKQYFENKILKTGYNYYSGELISEYNNDGENIIAVVEDTEPYYVEIKIDNNNPIDMRCSCLYALNGEYCKHMAAVLYFWENIDKSVIDNPNSEHKISVEDIVNNTDEISVRAFLTRLLENDKKLILKFKNFTQTEGSSNNLSEYKKSVDETFNRHMRHNEFIDYYETDDFINDLINFSDDIEIMINAGNYLNAFELSYYICAKSEYVDIDDSDDQITYLYNSMSDHWNKIAKKADDKTKSILFRRVLKILNEHCSEYDYLTDYMKNFLISGFNEKKFHQNIFDFIDNKVERIKDDSDYSSYITVSLINKRLNLMYDNEYSFDEILDYCNNRWEYSEVRKWLANIYEERKEYKKAISIYEDSIIFDNDYHTLVIEYRNRLKELYKKTGNKQKYIECLWELIKQPNGMEFYKELKECYSENEWIKKREKVFSSVSKYTCAKLFCEEKLYERLRDYITDWSFEQYSQFFDILGKIYPNDILDKYEETLNKRALNTANREIYKSWVELLRSMEKFEGGYERAKKIADEWKVKYKNRPAFMSELKKFF